MIEELKCSNCEQYLPLSSFHKANNTKRGYDHRCRLCAKVQKHLHYITNKPRRNAKNKAYYASHKEIENSRNNTYYAKHAEHLTRTRRSKSNNWDKLNKYRKQARRRIRIATVGRTIEERIAHNLRNTIRMALKNNAKSGSAILDLGCTIQEFKQWLEKQFYDNPRTGELMTWDNYGLKGWHIDHIWEVRYCDISNREEFVKLVHYTNLRPLWWFDNQARNRKYK